MPVMSRNLMLPPAARDRCPFPLGCLLTCLYAAVCWTQERPVSESQRATAQSEPVAGARFVLERGDVVAFVGGACASATLVGKATRSMPDRAT